MSIDREDCEHGHGALVVEIAAMIAADHGLSMKGAVLVILPGPADDTPEGRKGRVFGMFNTAALAVAADAVLELGAEHKPDGCVNCDAAAIAMARGRHAFREEYRALLQGSSPPSSAFEEYCRDPVIQQLFDLISHRATKDLARDAFARGAAWAMAEARARRAMKGEP